MPDAQWTARYPSAFESSLAFVQRLPASEVHQHAGPGGMLSHSLEVVNECLKLRRGRLIPSGASAEKLMYCQELWSYAVTMAALLRDLASPSPISRGGSCCFHAFFSLKTQRYMISYNRRDRNA